MSMATATVAETRANFSKIADSVSRSGHSVTVFKNSKPWVKIAPLGDEFSPIDWKRDLINPDTLTGITTLPASWNEEEDEGLYDHLV